MRSRPILSLAAHLNGRTWAMQLGGEVAAQEAKAAGPCRSKNARISNSKFGGDDAA
jgi:hypothetical protein